MTDKRVLKLEEDIEARVNHIYVFGDLFSSLFNIADRVELVRPLAHICPTRRGQGRLVRSETVSTSCLIVVSHCLLFSHTKRSNQASENRKIPAPEISEIDSAAAAPETKTKPGKLVCVHKQQKGADYNIQQSRATENSSHRESR